MAHGGRSDQLERAPSAGPPRTRRCRRARLRAGRMRRRMAASGNPLAKRSQAVRCLVPLLSCCRGVCQPHFAHTGTLASAAVAAKLAADAQQLEDRRQGRASRCQSNTSGINGSSASRPRACIAATMGSLLMSGFSATRRRPLKMMDATPTCNGLSRAPSRVSSGGSTPSPGAGSSCTASCTSCAAQPRGPGSRAGQGFQPYTAYVSLVMEQLPRPAHALTAGMVETASNAMRPCLGA